MAPKILMKAQRPDSPLFIRLGIWTLDLDLALGLSIDVSNVLCHHVSALS